MSKLKRTEWKAGIDTWDSLGSWADFLSNAYSGWTGLGGFEDERKYTDFIIASWGEIVVSLL
jgi:hypothetical protein